LSAADGVGSLLVVRGKRYGYGLSAGAGVGTGSLLVVGGKRYGYGLSAGAGAGAGSLLVVEFVRPHLRGDDTIFWVGSIEDVHRT